MQVTDNAFETRASFKPDSMETVRVLIKFLESQCKGALNAKHNKSIMLHMEAQGHKISDPATIRSLIQFIRVNDLLPGICSDTTHGYFLAESSEEMNSTLEKLRNRMLTQRATYNKLKRQQQVMRIKENPKAAPNKNALRRSGQRAL